LNLEVAAREFAGKAAERPAAQSVANFLSGAIYIALLLLLILPAIAYGGSDPWWKAAFTCLIFAVGVFAVLERILSDDQQLAGLRVILPLLALAAFSLLQTIRLPQNGPTYGINLRFWNSISADPYETRIFALQLLALALLGAMFFRYATSQRRLRWLIHVIVGIALVSAVFGLLRQTTQHQPGFLLPLLLPDQGYGQFINKNHFAYLMEVGFGLALGLIAAGGVRRERVLVYLAMLLPIWTALILANSRGGILAMLVQLVVTLLLFPSFVRGRHGEARTAWRLLSSRVVRLTLVVALIAMVLVGVLWIGGDRLATSIEAARGEFTESPQAREAVTRIKIWQATIKMIKANPIFGVGMGGYWAAIPTYHEGPGTMTPQQAHNDYLELAASGGIAGLIIFAWFAVIVLKNTRANLRSGDRFRRDACFAALIGIVGVAAHSIFDFGLHKMLMAMLLTALIVIATSNAGTEGNHLSSRG
jgi:O-antigen ligase